MPWHRVAYSDKPTGDFKQASANRKSKRGDVEFERLLKLIMESVLVAERAS